MDDSWLPMLQSLKKVTFNPTVMVQPIPRVMLKQDRVRFQRRILSLETLLAPFLSKRKKVTTDDER